MLRCAATRPHYLYKLLKRVMASSVSGKSQSCAEIECGKICQLLCHLCLLGLRSVLTHHELYHLSKFGFWSYTGNLSHDSTVTITNNHFHFLKLLIVTFCNDHFNSNALDVND